MKKIIFALAFLGLVSSCEQIVENPTWPEHNEKLVVYASLSQNSMDSLEVYCEVRKTLPLNVKFDSMKTIVDDADVKINFGGFAQELHPTSTRSVYYAKFPNPQKSECELIVKWSGKTARGRLNSMQYRRVIDTAYIDSSDGYWLVYDFKPLSTSTGWLSYFLLSSIAYPYIWSWSYKGGIFSYGDIDIGNGKIRRRTDIWFLIDMPRPTKLFLGTTSYSSEYNDFKEAARRWYGSDDPFEDSSENRNPKFNITGDGIGFFWYESTPPPIEIDF